MDIKDQKETWNGFVKFSTIAGAFIILILVMMAIFLV
jgi:hypothetical protein